MKLMINLNIHPSSIKNITQNVKIFSQFVDDINNDKDLIIDSINNISAVSRTNSSSVRRK